MIEGLVILETERPGLVLRQYTLSDAPAIFAAIDSSRDHLSQFGDDTASKYPTRESVEDSIRANNPRIRLRLGIWDEGKLVGGINLAPMSERIIAEIGYWLAAQSIGRYYATLATRTLVIYGRNVAGYRFLVAKVAIGNDKSVAVLERVGFSEIKPSVHGGQRWFLI